MPSMAPTARRLGTLWEALCALPSNQVGEIVAGELFASPQPAGGHCRVASKLGARLDGPFDSGVGGPGGWLLIDEPELHLTDSVLVPDLAGWRRERMPAVPEDLARRAAPALSPLSLRERLALVHPAPNRSTRPS
ncbi:MAG: hypothetical protein K0R38_5231 [Polyangiaceae bacterium]|nr:hypothetical protein [Polyangiaceae bacterium]